MTTISLNANRRTARRRTITGEIAAALGGILALAPEHRHFSVALMSAGFGAGQVVGALAAGLLFDATGGFVLPSLLSAAAVALLAAQSAEETRP